MLLSCAGLGGDWHCPDGMVHDQSPVCFKLSSEKLAAADAAAACANNGAELATVFNDDENRVLADLMQPTVWQDITSAYFVGASHEGHEEGDWRWPDQSKA